LEPAELVGEIRLQPGDRQHRLAGRLRQDKLAATSHLQFDDLGDHDLANPPFHHRCPPSFSGGENIHPAGSGVAFRSRKPAWEGTRMAGLDVILEPTTAERPATGFVFTEGPLWHPDDYYYFADVRSSVFYRLRPGQRPETVRSGTGEGNGTTF